MSSLNSPLRLEQQQIISSLVTGLDRDQALWLSGFFAGLVSSPGAAVGGQPPLLPSAEKRKLTVLYGTESGNCEKLADVIAKAAGKHGFKVTVTNMGDAKPADLVKIENLLVVISTWGEGDPPDAATSYYEGFMRDTMPQVPGINYSVCALGDTSYTEFCKMGKDFDRRLAELGAIRVYDRVDCDVDYQAAFDGWLAGALNAFPEPESVTATASLHGPVATSVVYDKENPYPSEILEKIVLNGTGSCKEVLHLEFSLEGSGLVYEPGDALGIYPENRATVIDAVLAATGLSANTMLGEKALADALRHDYDICTLAPTIIDKFNAIVGDPLLEALLAAEGRTELKAWIDGRQLIDLLEAYPYQNWTAESFTGILRKLTPRLYSIASSLKKHENEVHLTVASVRYHTHDRDRSGVASCYVADDLSVGDKVNVFFHHNNNFRLPENDGTPIIMVGPGTGIAPFRAFVEERSARGAKGKNWLFFGDQHFSYDFMYQLEWLEYLEDGTLTDLSLAFSRDQKEKIYVQHRLLERGAEIYEWLESGAHLYVCGDASRMAKDVQQALIEIIAQHGGKTPVEAKAYLETLRKAKRYQRDVY